MQRENQQRSSNLNPQMDSMPEIDFQILDIDDWSLDSISAFRRTYNNRIHQVTDAIMLHQLKQIKNRISSFEMYSKFALSHQKVKVYYFYKQLTDQLKQQIQLRQKRSAQKQQIQLIEEKKIDQSSINGKKKQNITQQLVKVKQKIKIVNQQQEEGLSWWGLICTILPGFLSIVQLGINIGQAIQAYSISSQQVDCLKCTECKLDVGYQKFLKCTNLAQGIVCTLLQGYTASCTSCSTCINQTLKYLSPPVVIALNIIGVVMFIVFYRWKKEKFDSILRPNKKKQHKQPKSKSSTTPKIQQTLRQTFQNLGDYQINLRLEETQAKANITNGFEQ